MVDRSWEQWVNENLTRGCDPQEMKEIMLKRGLPPAEIRRMLGEKYMDDATRPAATVPSNGRNHDSEEAIRRKSASLLEIQRNLARLNPNARVIERRKDLSASEFLEKYYAANRPVILCDLMTLWGAPSRWTPEYLKATCGEEMVEIMAARDTDPNYETDDGPHRRQIKFADFVDMVSLDTETNAYYLTARNEFFQRPGPKALLRDIEVFTEYLHETSGDGVYLWYGPKGTITPLHHDSMNIFMAQVHGRKQVKLIPAAELSSVYNHYSVYSQVDMADPDYARFPKFRDASAIDLELAPGEVLFLPVGWWHWVKALDRSMTVSFNNFLFPNDFQWEHPKRPEKAAAY